MPHDHVLREESQAVNGMRSDEPQGPGDGASGQGREDVCRAFLDASADGMMLAGDDGTVLFANPAVYALLGYPPGTLLGVNVRDLLLPPDNADPFASLLLPQGPDRIPRLVTARHAEGHTLYLESAASRTTIKGTPVFMTILRDVTARHEMDEVFQDSEERLGGVANNIPGIMFQRLMRPAGDLAYPYLSPACQEILGYRAEDVPLNREGDLDLVHWADRDARRDAILRSARDLTPCYAEFRAITRDSRIVWLREMARPQTVAPDTLLWDGVMIDVTDRRRAEQRFQMIMDHAGDAIITINENGVMETVNEAAATMFGYAPEALIGQNVSVLMPSPHSEHHDEYLRTYLATGETHLLNRGPREVEARRRNGTVFPFELSVSEVRTESGRIWVGVGRDVTLRQMTEAALRESEERLSTIAGNLPGLVFQRVLRPDGTLHYPYVSDGAREVLAIESEELISNPDLLEDMLHPADIEPYRQGLKRSADNLAPADEEIRVIANDGQLRWLRGRTRPRRTNSGAVVWDGILLDVTDSKEAEERLRFLAYYDPVTGIPNHAMFVETFTRRRGELENSGRGLAVISLGLDDFSIINATFGHATGDRVLRAAAERLENVMPEGAQVARASGDRFLVLMDAANPGTALADMVDRVRQVFTGPVVVDRQEFDLSVALGVALYPQHGQDPETLIKNADAALHQVKAEGGNGIHYYTQDMGERAAKTLALQAMIRRGVENEEFIAFYQPQVSLVSGRITGMEVLVRWMNPELGLVSPGEFIPVAEEYGLIDGICEQMLHQACQDNQRWQQAGLPAMPVAVNISGRQFQYSRRLVAAVDGVLRDSGMDPKYLELELTESSAMRDPDHAISVINTFLERGIQCAIDDFGTGYSSLSVLRRFPIGKLKIDRAFVRDVTRDPNDAAIVEAIIAMARALRLRVVAEGVETRDHLAFLKDLDCDQIQGFLFAKPLPAADMERMLREDVRLPLPEGRKGGAG